MTATLAVDFHTGITNAWDKVITFVPKFISFLIILIIAYIVARVISTIVDKVLQRVGFDRLVERGGIKAALARSKYDASDIVGKIIYYAVLLVGLSMAFGVFGTNPISTYLRSIVAFLPKLLVAILIIIVAAAVAKAVKDLITNMMGGLSYGSLLGTVASTFILVLGVIAALDQLEIARRVVDAVLYAGLAALVGVTVVGVGGGLIRPMQTRWENALGRLEDEAPRARQQVQASRGTSTTATTSTMPASGSSYGTAYGTGLSGAPTQVIDPGAGGTGGSSQVR